MKKRRQGIAGTTARPLATASRAALRDQAALVDGSDTSPTTLAANGRSRP